MKKIISSLESTARIIYLYGPRWGGKSSLLESCKDYLDKSKISWEYYSFDENVVSKHFESLDEFLSFLRLKTWCNPAKKCVLLLNEVQFCKNIEELLKQYVEGAYLMQIIATGAKWFLDERYQGIDTYIIYPFDFREYLQYLGYDTGHVPLDRGYKSVYIELQSHFLHFLKRWGYPAVIMQNDASLKLKALTQNIHHIISKDGWQIFNNDEIFGLERVFESIPTNNLRIQNNTHLALHTNQSVHFIKKCVDFVVSHFLMHLIPVTSDTKASKRADLMVFADIGIFHLMNNAFGTPLLDTNTLLTFVWGEITKLRNYTRSTFRKHNGSSIDIIGTIAGKRIAIIVDSKNTETIPKILQHPSTHDIRDIGIRTTLHHFGHQKVQGKDFYRMPPYLVSRWLYEKWQEWTKTTS